MSRQISAAQLSRRALLLGGAGAGAALTLGGRASAPADLSDAALVAAAPADIHLAASDGWVSIADPASTPAITPFWPDPYGAAKGPFDLYVFGFRNVTGFTSAQVTSQRGKAQITAPQLVFDEGTQVRVKLSNLGLSVRPDLTDGHSLHWHGFVNAIPLFDGVPELSISVPIGRDFTYFYRPHDAGTYMYHCHFEDVEHVQMGMVGLVFVRPKQNGNTTLYGSGKYAYNDGDGSTGYDREFGFMVNEVFVEGHYRDAHIQTTDWTDFKASFTCLNGRSYPDTLAPNGDPTSTSAGRLQYQPLSCLVRANETERVLLRIASLGYQDHALSVDGIPLTVVAKDAMQLRTASGTNYGKADAVEVAPGESRDVIFQAPAYDDTRRSTDVKGRYNSYLLYDRYYRGLANAGGPGLGGMATEIRVYEAGTLGAQTDPAVQANA